MARITDEREHGRERVAAGRAALESFFAEAGEIEGDVLDVGGGWGLYREWWRFTGHERWVIHDRGLARYLHGPMAAHREIYGRGLARPAIFVEGHGERLP